MEHGPKNFNGDPHATRVLVAPLDWGLGHATRCISIIDALISLHCKVYILASGRGYFLLKKEFPDTVILRCKSPEIRYSGTGSRNGWVMGLQVPKLWLYYRRDHRLLRRLIQEHQIEGVISDNRFGMWSTRVPSVYITHQLHIKTGHSLLDKWAGRWHRRIINKYNACWVPDDAVRRLAGALSKPESLAVPVHYLGPISRFMQREPSDIQSDLLIILSGPEPQRTLFENLLRAGLKNYEGKVLMVRGLAGEEQRVVIEDNIRVVNFMGAQALNEAMLQSDMVISRCGYSTVMDLVKLKKRAVLVPTPGQGEQEYLAHHLMENKYFYCTPQQGFSLSRALEEASRFDGRVPEYDCNQYLQVITGWVSSLKS